MMWYGDWGWGGWIIMAATTVVVWALIIPAVVLAIRYLGGGPRQGGATGSGAEGPEEALAHRFVRGEIDEDEYRRRAAVLREHR